MTKFIGRKIQVGIGKETTRGTGVAPSYWLSQMNADFDDKFEGVMDESALGVIEDAQDFKITKKWSEGELTGKISDKAFGLFLRALMGGKSSAAKGGDSGVYEHTFTVQEDAQHPTLTIEAKNPNEQLKFANGALDSMSLKAELGKFVEMSANIKAKIGAAAVNSPSNTAENSFLAKDAKVYFATNLAGLDAANAVDVKGFEIKFDKNVESDDVLGSQEPSDYLNKQFAVTGQIELVYNATTYKALALAGTQQAMRIVLEDTAVTIGSASHPKIKIDLAKVKLTEWAKSGDLNEIVKETLDFKAFYSLTDTSMITVVLTNTVAGYN